METSITGMGTKLVFIGQNGSSSEFQHAYPVNCKHRNCLSNATAQSRPICLQKAEIWTSKRLCVRRQKAQVTKKVSRQGDAVELDDSTRSSSEKQVLNPELQGAEKFQFKLSRKGGSRRRCHCAQTAVWKPRRWSREWAVSHSGWVIDQRCVQRRRTVREAKSLHSGWLFGYLLFALMHN